MMGFPDAAPVGRRDISSVIGPFGVAAECGALAVLYLINVRDFSFDSTGRGLLDGLNEPMSKCHELRDRASCAIFHLMDTGLSIVLIRLVPVTLVVFDFSLTRNV